jgi:hypothetical protein
MAQVNHRFVTTLKEDGDQRIYWKTLQVRTGYAVPSSCFRLRCVCVGQASGLQH